MLGCGMQAARAGSNQLAASNGLEEPLLAGEDPPRRPPSLTLSPKRGGHAGGSQEDGPDTPQLRSMPLNSPFSSGRRPEEGARRQEDESDEEVEGTPARGPVRDLQAHYIDLDSTSDYGSGTSDHGSPLAPRTSGETPTSRLKPHGSS